jgi:hypothetical protein
LEVGRQQGTTHKESTAASDVCKGQDFLGVVLVYLLQRRPEGLLGHRKEESAAVDLSRRPGRPGGDGRE